MSAYRSASETRQHPRCACRQGSVQNPHESGPREAPLGASSPRLSLRDTYRGSSVLLTGVTGYVGSLVLEQLLRVCPDVDKVYVLVRAKKSMSARDRLDRLLRSGLFNMLWDLPHVLAKIYLIEGDVRYEGLNFSRKDTKEVLQNTEYVIHSAAAVALASPIQETLRNNYRATENLLEMCCQMPKLKSFGYVSTAYVGIREPKGSTVKEKIYPLMDGDEVADHRDIVAELLRMSEEDAGERSKMHMMRWNIPNTYCLSKHLAEQLVASYHKKPFPVCIIRPSMISAIAGDPYPGYTGNLAGGGGYSIAFALGFFEKYAHAWMPKSVVDTIPGDISSSIILAAVACASSCPLEEDKPGIFHACSSTTYPITSAEMYWMAQKFCTANPPPYSFLLYGYPNYPANYKPNPYLVWLGKSMTALKVHAAYYILWWMGKARTAQRLYTGWRAWSYGNQQRYDMDLYFSTKNTRALDAMLVDEEKKDVRCLWTQHIGDWNRYTRTVIAGIMQLFLKTAVRTHEDHDFKFIPPRESLPSISQIELCGTENGLSTGPCYKDGGDLVDKRFSSKDVMRSSMSGCVASKVVYKGKIGQ